MKHYLLASLFMSLATITLGQNIPEANHWFFGYNAAISFSSGSPVAIPHSYLMTSEGCAAISDKYGELLFYTDGMTVWNKAHSVMSNGTGLMGGSSSTQSALIVQKPCARNHYYIFTTAQESYPEGLRYSEVDMELEEGLGAIIFKNTPLATPVNEKLTVIRHSNDKDLWIITRESGSDLFFANLVTSEGVNPDPVISSAGTTTDESGVGYMKASPDGSTIVSVNTNGPRNIDVLSFDRSSGIVSDGFSFVSILDVPYSAEFSPDGNLLYIASWTEPSIYQYDLTLSNANDIVASAMIIGTCTVPYGWFQVIPNIGALQIGPDGKIYFAKTMNPTLGCITNPNALGVSCGFIETAVQLTGNCDAGLPNFQMNYRYNTCDPLGAIPNIITPNNDGTNDVFQINNLAPERASLTIYNRWGNSVFSTASYLNNWTGDGLVEGVYFYLLTDLEEEETYSGFVEIIR